MFRKSLLLAGLVLAWLAAVAAGQFWLWGYQAGAGLPADAPADWPAGSALRPEPGRFTLLLFAHPRCPCTRASLQELSRVLAHTQGKVDAFVVFVLPTGAPDDWRQGSLGDASAEIPGVRAVADDGGREARCFGAETSGQALLYDPRGRLVFRGGLTAGRGHEGDNPGRAAVVACVAGASPARGESPVFGCPLFDPE